jgi:hypothetical protein
MRTTEGTALSRARSRDPASSSRRGRRTRRLATADSWPVDHADPVAGVAGEPGPQVQIRRPQLPVGIGVGREDSWSDNGLLKSRRVS